MADPALAEISPDTLAIVGTVVATGLALFFGLGTMAWRMTARLDRRIDADKAAADADRRAFLQRADDDRSASLQRADDDRSASLQRADDDRSALLQRADADRRAFQASVDDFRKEMQRSRDDFRAEMQRLAERQSHVEGRVRPAE